jgi:hypothetical protein
MTICGVALHLVAAACFKISLLGAPRLHLDHSRRSAPWALTWAWAGLFEGLQRGHACGGGPGRRAVAAGFWLALAVGLALRAWYLSDLIAQPWFGYPLVDELTFDRAALGILRGDIPESSRGRRSTLVLAVIYRIAGHRPRRSPSCKCLGLAARCRPIGSTSAGSGRAALGAWIAACYPLRIFFEAASL